MHADVNASFAAKFIITCTKRHCAPLVAVLYARLSGFGILVAGHSTRLLEHGKIRHIRSHRTAELLGIKPIVPEIYFVPSAFVDFPPPAT